jgi:dolichyl-phosphate-mannose-protein mannosyltransferase
MIHRILGGKEHRQIYLIGNSLVWHLSTLSVAAYILVRGFLILRAQRGFRDPDSSTPCLSTFHPPL